jgi:tetratricopeptide (TPR) repeat protein
MQILRILASLWRDTPVLHCEVSAKKWDRPRNRLPEARIAQSYDGDFRSVPTFLRLRTRFATETNQGDTRKVEVVKFSMPPLKAKWNILCACAAFALLPASLAAQDNRAVLRHAVELFNAGRIADAEFSVGALLAKQPSHPDALVLLGFIQLRRNTLSQAQRTFELALEKYRDFAPAQLGLGLALRQQGQLEESGQQFEKLLNDPALGYQAHLQWIDSLYLQGKMHKALEEVQSLTRRLPSDPQSIRLLGLIREASGDQEGALAAFRTAVELKPNRLDNYLSLIELLKIRGKWDEVLAYTEAALRLDAGHPLLFRHLALAQRALGLVADASATEREADNLLAAEMLYTRAVLARKAGRLEEYEQLLIQCARTSPRVSRAWADIGQINFRHGRFQEARNAFIMALEVNPDSLPAYLGMAATFRSMSRPEEAAGVYRRAMDRGISSPDLYSGLAAIYLEQGKTTLATSEIRQARERWPDNAELHIWQGRVLQEIDDHALASRSFEAALKLEPGRADALGGKAESESRSGKLNEAMASYKQATGLQPGEETGWLGLINAFRKAGYDEKAELASRSCLKWNPQSADCLEELAHLRMAASDFSEAILHYEAIRKLRADSKSVLDGLGYCFMKTGRWEQARTLFDASLKHFGPEASALGQLGFIERSLGQVDQAVVHYLQASALAPQDAGLHHDLAFALYLKGDYANAAGHFLISLRIRPGWGMAHYNLALNYWQMRDYAAALTHARSARNLGISQAAGIEQTLMAHLSLGSPRSVWMMRHK